jgi:hypothetical protein
MKTLSKPQFLKTFSAHGIALDTRYNPPQTLTFTQASDCWGSWQIPSSPKALPRFVTGLFEACEETQGFYLYPRVGWGADSLQQFQTRAVFAACGVDPASEDVLHASIDEMDAVETLFAIALIHGGTVGDDLFAIPSHGQIVLYADHHEQVIVECFSSECFDRFEATMQGHGYEH